MAALGRPREEEAVALGKPKDGEGNLESATAEGKPLMCSLSTGRGKKNNRRDSDCDKTMGSYTSYKSRNATVQYSDNLCNNRATGKSYTLT